MSLISFTDQSRMNPLDVVERVASSNGWSFERAGEDEITILVTGKWTDYLGLGQFDYFHPTFLYESLWDFGVFLALVLWLRPKLRNRPGALFFFYVGLYSIGRFAIEALRLDSFWLGSFRVPQIASLVGLLVAALGLLWTRRRATRLAAS